MSDSEYTEEQPERRRRKRRRSKRKRSLGDLARQYGISCFLVLVLILSVPVVLLLQAPAPPEMPTGVEQEQSEQHLRDLKTQIEDLGKAPSGRPFTLTVSQNDLNVFLRNDAQARDLLETRNIEDAYVRVEGGRIKATAVRAVGSVHVSISADIVPSISYDGLLNMDVRSLSLGHLPYPQWGPFVDQLTRAIRERISASSVRYKSVSVHDRTITVTGETLGGRPAAGA